MLEIEIDVFYELSLTFLRERIIQLLNFWKRKEKTSERDLRSAECAESRCGHLRSGPQPIRGQVRWSTDQSEASILQAETLKITAVKYPS